MDRARPRIAVPAQPSFGLAWHPANPHLDTPDVGHPRVRWRDVRHPPCGCLTRLFIARPSVPLGILFAPKSRPDRKVNGRKKCFVRIQENA
jgi:hypothetical protein